MENFIYSVNATIPVFLVMIIGYILKQIDMLDDHFAAKANKFNFKVTLPCLLFSDIAKTDMSDKAIKKAKENLKKCILEIKGNLGACKAIFKRQ